MKTYNKAILALTLTSIMSATQAAPYIGIGYGTASEDSISATFNNDTGLKTSKNVSLGQFFVGYKFDQSFGLEVSYNAGSNDSGRDIRDVIKQDPAGFPAGKYKLDEEYDLDYERNQMILMPKYFNNISKKVTFIAGLGLSYTDYSIKSSHKHEYENIVTDIDYNRTIESASLSEKKLGVAASVGFDYNITDNINVGMNTQYVNDKIQDSLQGFINLSYNL